MATERKGVNRMLGYDEVIITDVAGNSLKNQFRVYCLNGQNH